MKARRRFRLDAALDNVFFVIAGFAAVWLAYLVLVEGFQWGWGQVWFYLLFWVVLAYLVLPRLHRILTNLYVPNYFIGRARTSDGLLGDPVNLGMLGSAAQVHAAMTAAGWTLAEELSLRSGWRIVASTLRRRSYLTAPVSPLMLFDRQQDFAYQQEVGGSPGKRHHVRFWRCPPGWLLPGGIPVEWLAAGTYDRSVGLSLFTLQVTHKIAADTDTERDHVVTTMTAADPAVGVSVIKDFSSGYHSRNGGGDSIVTDGDLPIVDLSAVAAPAEVAVVSTGVRRPGPIAAGALLVVARALAGAGMVVTLLSSWETRLDTTITGADRHVILWVVVAILAVFVLVELLFAFLVYAGRHGARIVVMLLSTVSILSQAIDYLDGGPRITLQTNLIGLSLDILVLLALSSSRARAYSGPAARPPAGSGEPAP